jgi:hypothetical protein
VIFQIGSKYLLHFVHESEFADLNKSTHRVHPPVLALLSLCLAFAAGSTGTGTTPRNPLPFCCRNAPKIAVLVEVIPPC